MFDSTFKVAQPATRRYRHRDGAIVPLFAMLLPVLLVLCGFAVNLAYMQLVSTEMKVATDAAAHAGGRAMSIHQTTEAAIAQAQTTAEANPVAGKVITVSSSEDNTGMVFGRSTRGNNGYGRYEFEEVARANIDNRTERATSFGVNGRVNLPMAFNVMEAANFTVSRRSIATQVDRDIALVLDRSGSMLYFRDDDLLTETLEDLYNTWDTTVEEGHWKYAYWSRSRGRWRFRGYYKPEDAHSSWYQDTSNRRWQNGTTSRERRISSSELGAAKQSLYNRQYTNNVIYQLERYLNDFHTLGSSFSTSEKNELESDMAQYVYDWKYESGAARHSRWYYLDLGVTRFLDILEFTDQEELVSLVTFSSSARLDYGLLEDYDPIRNYVSSIKPYGGTAVGDGLLEGLPPIVDGDAARPFAAKTIVVLTDGISNSGEDPEDAVRQIIGSNNVTIHTVTFGTGADQARMQTIAAIGGGRHYHADTGAQLISIFEEIANNLPTILTK